MAKRSAKGATFYFILNLFMILMYGCGGVILYFWKFPQIPDSSRKIFAGVLVLYAIYRGAVLYNKFKNADNEK